MDSTWLYIILGGTLLVFFLVTIVIVSFILYFRIYNFKWKLISDVSGRPEETKKGRCKQVGFGKGNLKIFYIPYLKRYEAANIRTGKNQITWAEGKDGTWTDVGYQNIDLARREIGLLPANRNIQMGAAAQRKMFELEFSDKSLLTKLALPLTLFMLFLCICAFGVSQYYAVQQNIKAISISLDVAKANKEVADSNQRVIDSLQVLKADSGMVKSG